MPAVEIMAVMDPVTELEMMEMVQLMGPIKVPAIVSNC
jgi:hypothetical protein